MHARSPSQAYRGSSLWRPHSPTAASLSSAPSPRSHCSRHCRSGFRPHRHRRPCQRQQEAWQVRRSRMPGMPRCAPPRHGTEQETLPLPTLASRWTWWWMLARALWMRALVPAWTAHLRGPTRVGTGALVAVATGTAAAVAVEMHRPAAVSFYRLPTTLPESRASVVTSGSGRTSILAGSSSQRSPGDQVLRQLRGRLTTLSARSHPHLSFATTKTAGKTADEVQQQC
mmetsp:Transcript_35825/g.101396  ORF Transcript_35825/g.101396 Transcript_35825/m.101396 type:complete len:228 (+) Transcript_35825:288-971(+)